MNPTTPLVINPMEIIDYEENLRLMHEWKNEPIDLYEKDVQVLRRNLKVASLVFSLGSFWPLGSIFADAKKYTLIADGLSNLLSAIEAAGAMPENTNAEVAKKEFVKKAIEERIIVFKKFSQSVAISILGKTALQVAFCMLGVSFLKILKEQKLQPQSLWGIPPLLLGGGIMAISVSQRDALQTKFRSEIGTLPTRSLSSQGSVTSLGGSSGPENDWSLPSLPSSSSLTSSTSNV